MRFLISTAALAIRHIIAISIAYIIYEIEIERNSKNG